jgi:DNA polymerase
MTPIILDLETRSVADLKTVGAWVYSEHDTTDIICMSWKEHGKNKVHMWWPGDKVPELFKQKDAVFVAHNALFEHALFTNVLIPRYKFPKDMTGYNKWYCTRAMGVVVGMPGGLKDLAKALKVPHLKQESGTYLINRYSNPIKKGVNEFRELQGADRDLMVEYNIGDVLATEDIYKTLKDLPNVKLERTIFLLDMKQNVEGLPIDVKNLKKVNKVLDKRTGEAEKLMTEIGVNVRSVPQLKKYLKSVGFKVPDIQRPTIEYLLTQKIDKKTRQLLVLRLFLGKASTKKYKALTNRLSNDGKLRHFIMYFGAHTGRYSSRGVQVHNMAKTGTDEKEINILLKKVQNITDYHELVNTTKKIFPGLIQAPKEYTFLMGDFNAIEARGAAYLAGQDDLLNDFRKGIDPYVNMAAIILNINRKEVTKKQRAFGKVAILAPQYGMGAKRLVATCIEWCVPGVGLALAKKVITLFRQKYSKIVNFWYDVEGSFTKAFRTKSKVRLGLLTFEGKNKYVRITLPNGRELYYHDVRVTQEGISYINKGRKMKVHVWGGLLVENIVQGMCRDILVECMLECEWRKLNPVLHVHDEIVCRVSKVAIKQGLDEVLFYATMNTAPTWLPGFPLSTEIEVSRRYHK